MTLPVTLAKAFAPLAAAAVSTGVSFTAAGAACLVSAGLLWLARSGAPSGVGMPSPAPSLVRSGLT